MGRTPVLQAEQAENAQQQQRRTDRNVAHGEAKTLDETAHRRFACSSDLFSINTHHQQRDDYRQKTERIQEKAPTLTDEYDRKTCDGWPDNARAIEDRGIKRDGVGQILLADHMNKKGLSNGNVEGVHNADQKGDENQLPSGNDMGQRRDYWNELRRLGDRDAARRFKDARWSLLKAPQNLTGDQAATLRRLKHAGGEVWRAYTLKEALRAIFAPSLTLQDVTILIDRFISKAARSRLAPFVRLGQTIRRHRDGILQAIRLGINQGRTEALNNKVRLITRRAYGFHSADAALALVMLTCGPITLTPPHEAHL